MSVGCLLLVALLAGITGGDAAACGVVVVTAGDGDLETGGVEDREVGGGDTCGRIEITFVNLGGDTVRFESENVKDTSGEGLMYEAWTTDPTVLGSGLFCRQGACCRHLRLFPGFQSFTTLYLLPKGDSRKRIHC